MASGEKFITHSKAILQIKLSMGDSKSETKQFPMVSHKAPLSVLGPLLFILYVNDFPEPRIYYLLFYLPMILLYF